MIEYGVVRQISLLEVDIANIEVSKVIREDLGKLGFRVEAEHLKRISRELRIIVDVSEDASGEKGRLALDDYKAFVTDVSKVPRTTDDLLQTVPHPGAIQQYRFVLSDRARRGWGTRCGYKCAGGIRLR